MYITSKRVLPIALLTPALNEMSAPLSSRSVITSACLPRAASPRGVKWKVPLLTSYIQTNANSTDITLTFVYIDGHALNTNTGATVL